MVVTPEIEAETQEASTYITQLRETMKNLTAPLQEQLAQVTAEIDQAQARLTELRQARNMLSQTLRAIDPDLAPPLYKTNGKKKSVKKAQGSHLVGRERLETLTTWLQERRDEMNQGEGFYASQLVERDDFDIFPSQSGLSKALIDLHERGVVRLVGQGGIGGRKFFKVV